MHTAAKVMLILGSITTVIGAIMFALGAVAIDYDPIGDAEWKGESGTFTDDPSAIYGVYSLAPSCDDISYTIVDGDGVSAISHSECDDSTQNVDGYIYLGSLWSVGPYSIDSTQTVYISDLGDEVGEAAGGIMTILGSFGALCCGGFMLLFGVIFALTLNEGPKVTIIGPGGVQMQAGQTMAGQFPQPVQQQAPMQQQYQQPVHQQPVQQQPVQQQPVQQHPFDQQPPQGGF